MRSVVLALRSRTKTSTLSLVSTGIRFVAKDLKPTTQPLALTAGISLSALPCEPSLAMLTRAIAGTGGQTCARAAATNAARRPPPSPAQDHMELTMPDPQRLA